MELVHAQLGMILKKPVTQESFSRLQPISATTVWRSVCGAPHRAARSLPLAIICHLRQPMRFVTLNNGITGVAQFYVTAVNASNLPWKRSCTSNHSDKRQPCAAMWILTVTSSSQLVICHPSRTSHAAVKRYLGRVTTGLASFPTQSTRLRCRWRWRRRSHFHTSYEKVTSLFHFSGSCRTVQGKQPAKGGRKSGALALLLGIAVICFTRR